MRQDTVRQGMEFEKATFGWPSAFYDSVHHGCDPVGMALSGALDNRLLDLADEIYEEGKADGFALGLVEGARQALDAAEFIAEQVTAENELCDCGCGLTYDEIYTMDQAFGESGCDCGYCDPEPEDMFTPEPIDETIVILSKQEYDALVERIEAVEYETGLKYVG